MSRRRRSRSSAPATTPSSRRASNWRDSEVELAAAIEQLEALYAALPALACKGLCQHSCDEHVEASDLEHARARAAGVDLTAPTATGACPALVATFGAGRCAIHPVRPMVCRLWGIAASMPCPHGCLPDLAGWSAPPDGKPGHGTLEATTSDDVTGHDVDVEHAAPRLGGQSAAAGPADGPGHGLGVAPRGSAPSAGSAAPSHLPDAVALRSMMAVLQLGGHDAAAPGVPELLEACAGDELAAGLMARLLRGDPSVKPALGARLQQLRTAARPRTAPLTARRTAAAALPEGNTGGGAR